MRLSDRIRKLSDDADPDPTSVMIVLNEEGKALILRRGSTAPWLPGYWNLPGGGIDEGESPEKAAIRELREETNLRPESVSKVMKKKFPSEGFTLHVFKTDGYKGNIHLDENDKYEWVGLEDLNDYRFVPAVKKILQDVLSH